MNLPDRWGAGSIFAFSALDGRNTWSQGVVGTLLADRIGVLFHTTSRRTLTFGIPEITQYEPLIIDSDCIRLKGKNPQGNASCITLFFYSEDTVLGLTDVCFAPIVECENLILSERHDNNLYHSTEIDGVKENSVLHCELLEDGIRFSLSFSRISMEDAADKASLAAHGDIESIGNDRMNFLGGLGLGGIFECSLEKTLYKCFSNMKSQLYSPEGRFTTRWTTPDRLPHKNLWLWDSVFHSLGNRFISCEVAAETLEAVFAAQTTDGFIPIMATPVDDSFQLTQPPLLAWGILKLYRISKDLGLVRRCYRKLRGYLFWNRVHRDANRNGLMEWKVDHGNRGNRCGESGMDNSPRFDNAQEMDCVDFSCFMASEYRCMAELAGLLNEPEEALFWSDEYESIKHAINDILWDESVGFYYDRVLSSGQFREVKAISGFLPLFAGLCSRERAARLISHLTDRNSFNTVVPLPSIARDDTAYQADMWRGPVWLNYTYMIIEGLKEYGYGSLAADITNRTLNAVVRWYLSDGCIYECYDCDDTVSPAILLRKGELAEPYDFRVRIQNVRDFGWTSAVTVALAMEMHAE